MLRPSGARMVSDPAENHQRTCSHRPSSNRRSRAPQSTVLPILQSIFKCQSGGLGRRMGPAWSMWPTLAEVSTQPCKTEKTPCLGYCMYKVQCTGYKDLQSAGEGPLRSPTHTGARRFSAPYSKSHRGRGQSTSHRPRLPSLIPPFSASLSWRDVSEVVPHPWNADWKNILAHKNQV